VVGEARREERKWEALWSYRANAPMADRETVLAFDTFLAQLGLADGSKPEPTEITDEEIKRLMKAGRMGWQPPEG
jgi:hypothetical protein